MGKSPQFSRFLIMTAPLSSIESQPKKVVVLVFVVIVVGIIVCNINLTSKFGQNCFNNILVVVVIVLVFSLLIQNLALKVGPNQAINS